MDENPYQSPAIPLEASSSASAAGSSRPPPSLGEFMLYGGMVGVLYHSAAGFLLGIGLGIYQALNGQAATAEQLVGVCAVYALAGAMVGVASGLSLGLFAMTLHWIVDASSVLRICGRTLVFGAHAYLGTWVGTLFFETLFLGPAVLAEGPLDSTTTRTWRLCLVTGAIIGSLLGALIDRRLQRTLARLRTTSPANLTPDP